MPPCNRCGEEIKQAAAEDAKAVLNFCMTYSLRPEDLAAMVLNFRMMSDYMNALSDKQRGLIDKIIEEWKKSEGIPESIGK